MDFYLAAVLSLTVCFLVTPLVIIFAKKYSFIDFPTRPHPAIIHKKPLPRAGGAAIFFAIFTIYALAALFDPSLITKHMVGVFLGGLIVVIVGLLDDKHDINPYVRLASNFLAAGIVIAFGVGVTFIANPLGGLIRFDEIIFSFTLPNVGFFGGPHSIVLFADLFALLCAAFDSFDGKGFRAIGGVILWRSLAMLIVLPLSYNPLSLDLQVVFHTFQKLLKLLLFYFLHLF